MYEYLLHVGAQKAAQTFPNEVSASSTELHKAVNIVHSNPKLQIYLSHPTSFCRQNECHFQLNEIVALNKSPAKVNVKVSLDTLS